METPCAFLAGTEEPEDKKKKEQAAGTIASANASQLLRLN